MRLLAHDGENFSHLLDSWKFQLANLTDPEIRVREGAQLSSERLVSIGELERATGLGTTRLRRLADSGDIPSVRTSGGHRRFEVAAVLAALDAGRHHAGGRDSAVLPGPGGQWLHDLTRPPDWSRAVALVGLEEHLVWADVRQDLDLDVSTNGGRILQHAFTEMLNNAIDHSRGTAARIEVWSAPDALTVRIHDDGQGVFAHVRRALDLGSDLEAVAELTKGKVTTMPAHHTGEGIFFTSKAADLFQLSSGGIRWTVDNLRDDIALGVAPTTAGTTVLVRVAPRTTRELREVFSAFTRDFEFVRSRPTVQLFGLGMAFVSRSEARRLLSGMEKFAEIEIDFAGVDDVGQGFVDELVRVWPSQHPSTRLEPINMNEAVEFMVRRGLPPRQ